MNRKIAGSVAAAAMLALGAAACGSSPGSSSSSSAKPLTIVTTPLSPFTQNFNPFLPSSTGYTMHVTNLINQPLMVFNTQNSSAKPVPELATGYSWSSDGTTLTVNLRSGVKWSDGKSFSSGDVAYTFNLLKNNQALNANWQVPISALQSAAASGANTVTLTFSQPEVANTYFILQAPIVAQHVWQSVSNPVTYQDSDPVGTGPFVLDHFSSTDFTLKVNPNYYGKSTLKVSAINIPAYNANANLQTPCSNGTIDWCGIGIQGVQQNYLSKSKSNSTWSTASPFFTANNVVGLWFNVTKAPLNDPAVRQAISFAINRQQLSTDGESGEEPPITNTAGILPAYSSYLPASLANTLNPNGDTTKAGQILQADGYSKVGGFWQKNGQKITFSIEVPSTYTDYYTDAQLLARQLQAAGINASAKGDPGANGPTTWTNDLNSGNFDAAIHWGSQGLTPYYTYDNWFDSTGVTGKTAGFDYGRFNSPAAQAAFQAYAKASSPEALSQAISTLANIEATQVPVAPLMAGASWGEFSTRNYTGWPGSGNPYMDPGPNIPEILVVVQQLKPVS
ncbi:MAG TPA: ABC transporter substrate-binding protein [Streptosporangiaceae bacterium]|nr:ABC transporter substrate-binding protein [Streptosporangiaceae bacterium]